MTISSVLGKNPNFLKKIIPLKSRKKIQLKEKAAFQVISFQM